MFSSGLFSYSFAKFILAVSGCRNIFVDVFFLAVIQRGWYTSYTVSCHITTKASLKTLSIFHNHVVLVVSCGWDCFRRITAAALISDSYVVMHLLINVLTLLWLLFNDHWSSCILFSIRCKCHNKISNLLKQFFSMWGPDADSQVSSQVRSCSRHFIQFICLWNLSNKKSEMCVSVITAVSRFVAVTFLLWSCIYNIVPLKDLFLIHKGKYSIC